jgi:hypothetical protein
LQNTIGGTEMAKKKLEPVMVNLKIEDCGDCPCFDADEDYSVCMMKGGPKLPVYRRAGQIITPPKGCPLRKLQGKMMNAGDLERG